eukprot:TRINITY_DN12427_c0_g1_i11.p2 TRINITY_DN12427_c0_g1~~TRINITY_DN12427_c0_g1_i11.p2  ORF type:complete len:197 (+),score=36.23 TRINITY_DN12427_c0_g1_i11:70-660(+)
MAKFCTSGGLAALFSLLVIAACVVALIPSVNWAEAKVDVTLLNKTVAKETLTVSLWQACTLKGGCTKIGQSFDYWKNTTNFKTQEGAERNGAIAGLVLGGLFALIALIPICCKSKCTTMILEFLSLACISAATFCLIRYKTHTLDVDLDGIDYDYSYTVGFFVVASGTVSALLALISSFCIKTHDEYETLEGYTFA